jgi:hypothetical protein
MNQLRALVVGVVTLALSIAALAQPAPTAVQGVVVDVVKDQTKAAGSITVEDSKGKDTKFVVTEATVFQFVQGAKTWGTNFLSEYVGRQVSVTPAAGSDPLTAATVQIILPKPPPPRPPSPPQVDPVQGTVVNKEKVGKGIYTLTVQLPSYIPPAPVKGTIWDVGKSETTAWGSITLKVKGKAQVFYVNPTTGFTRIKGQQVDSATFLSATLGEKAVIHPRYGNSAVAARVELLGRKSKFPKEIQPKPVDQLVVFQADNLTQYSVVRNGSAKSCTIATVKAGRDVSVLPGGDHSQLATKVTVLMGSVAKNPKTTVKTSGTGKTKTISGAIVSAGNNTLSVQTSSGTKTASYGPGTQMEVKQGNIIRPAVPADFQAGYKVTVVASVDPPYAAQSIVIRVPAKSSTTGKGTTPKENTKPKKSKK